VRIQANLQQCQYLPGSEPAAGGQQNPERSVATKVHSSNIAGKKIPAIKTGIHELSG